MPGLNSSGDHDSYGDGEQEKAAAEEERVVGGRLEPGPADGYGANHSKSLQGKPACDTADGAALRKEDRQSAAHQEPLGAGVGSVSGADLDGAGLVEAGHEDGRGNGEGQRREKEGSRGAISDSQEREDDERPDQVPLLLDAQRPGVAERRVVRVADDDHPPVRYRTERGDGVAAQVVQLLRRRKDDGVTRNAEHEQKEGGKESASAS